MFMLRNQKKFRMHILLLLQVNNIFRRHNYYYFLHTKEQLIRCSLLIILQLIQNDIFVLLQDISHDSLRIQTYHTV